MEAINSYLQKKTNFNIKPVNGDLSERYFLNALAFRTFCSTQFIRYHSSWEHSPEGDIVHQYFGHMPMFLDPLFCDICQLIGELSLGASDNKITELFALFFYLVEFGAI